jgi:hypothetical protein
MPRKLPPTTEEYRESKGAYGGIEVYDDSEESRARDKAWNEFGRTADPQVLIDAGIWAEPID